LEGLLEAIEASAAAQTMRRSVWLYPVANVVHVLGVMIFFAAVAAMDVKAIRAKHLTDVRAFIRRVRPVAVAVLLAQVATGIMLFLPEATHIAHNGAFQLKLGVILVALINVGAFETMMGRALPDGKPPVAIKLVAVASLALWLTVAALGRLIAYF
jgi:hypothetical protein